MKIVLIYVGAYYDYCALVEIHNNLDKCDDDRAVDRVDVALVLLLVVMVHRDNGHEARWKDVDEMDDDADEAEVVGLLLFVEAVVEGNDSHRPLNAVAVGVVWDEGDHNEDSKVPCTEKP